MTFVERCKRPTDAIAAQQRCFELAMDDVLGQIIKNFYQQRRDEYIDESDCIYKIRTIARAINQNHNIRKHIIMTGGK